MPTITRKIELYIDKSNLTDDEYKANEVIDILAKNIVTPITADNVLHDLGYFD